jgi:hypothetical protein
MNNQTLLFLMALLSAGFVYPPPACGMRGAGLKSSELLPHQTASVSARAVPKAKWTVMLFMNGDNSLNDYAISDFEEMAKVRYSPLVNVVVQLDRIGGNDTDAFWGETRRFLMRKNLKPTRSNSLQHFNEESNMGDPSTLASFVTWAKTTFPAERYMLVIWSHGDGWRRMIKEEQSTGEAARLRGTVAEANRLLMKGEITDSKLASMNLMQTSLDTHFRTISEDESNNFDKLFVREIQDSLEGVFKNGGKLELIGFDACLMQMIETAYAMRNVADVMVGSEELEPSQGWSYNGWLQPLANDPDMNGSTVGKLIVESYKKAYERAMPDTTLSAVKLSEGQIERLATAISALSRELIIGLDTESPQIIQARLSCNVFAPNRSYHGIDLHRFCNQLAEAKVNPQLRARAKDVTTLIESSVIHSYAGRYRQDNFGSRGLAIYFPADRTRYQDDKYKSAYTDENEFQVVQFVREHIWDNFLHAYFKRT